VQDNKAFGAGEEAFRLIVETIPGLIAIMTPSGEVEHVNSQVLDYFGRTLEELKRWGTTEAVHPDDLPRVITAWQHAVEMAQPYEAEKMAKRIRRIDKQTLELCERYAWPGNIRELQNIVERSVILCSGDTFSIDDAWLPNQAPVRTDGACALPEALQDQEKEMIEAALAKSQIHDRILMDVSDARPRMLARGATDRRVVRSVTAIPGRRDELARALDSPMRKRPSPTKPPRRTHE
jgi:PAS domain S-box-containing protein